MELIDVGERFAEERQRLGYTQASFARLLDVTRMTLINIEAGKSDFKITQLIAAASAGVDIQYVITGVRSPNTKKVTDEIGFEKQAIHGAVSGVGFAGPGANVQIIHTQNHRTTVKAETRPGVDHIDEGQCAILKDLVDTVVEKEMALKKSPKSHRAVWSALNKHCGVATYRLIARADFEKARSYLNQWIGGLHGMRSAPVKDGDDWRKRKIQYIKVNTKAPEDEAAMRAYISSKFGATSLTELANDDLEKTYRYVAGRRNKRK